MKRSEVNRAINDAIGFFQQMGFALPAFAYWTPDEWRIRGPEYDEIRHLCLGWDVTDFGSGDLSSVGRTIFTLRNGSTDDPRYPKSYAQKVMHMIEGQKSVIHYHRSKMEDIFNQGGGNILISLWSVSGNNLLGEAELELAVSGKHFMQPAGTPLRLVPGESVCVPPRTYHQFWAEPEHGSVLSVEVSSVCDDRNDNIFLDSGQRFPPIDEDEPPQYVLCHEYEQYVGISHGQDMQL